MESSTVDRAAIDAEHKAQFEAEAGEAVGPMPPEAPRDEQPPVEELRVDGTAQLGIFDAGGKRPTEATLRLQCGAITLAAGGAYEKGAVINFSGVAVVREVKQKDAVDKETGIVTACTQSHTAAIVDLTVNT